MHDAIHVEMEFPLIFGKTNFVELQKSAKFIALKTSKHLKTMQALQLFKHLNTHMPMHITATFITEAFHLAACVSV